MDLAVHGGLIAFVCVCVCVCVCVREKTFLLRHKSESNSLLSTGSHPALVQMPRESCSAQPGQSSDCPNLSPHKKSFRFFSFLSPVFGERPSKHSQTREAKDRSFNVQTIKVEGGAWRHNCFLSRPGLGQVEGAGALSIVLASSSAVQCDQIIATSSVSRFT